MTHNQGAFFFFFFLLVDFTVKETKHKKDIKSSPNTSFCLRIPFFLFAFFWGRGRKELVRFHLFSQSINFIIFIVTKEISNNQRRITISYFTKGGDIVVSCFFILLLKGKRKTKSSCSTYPTYIYIFKGWRLLSPPVVPWDIAKTHQDIIKCSIFYSSLLYHVMFQQVEVINWWLCGKLFIVQLYFLPNYPTRY